MSYAKRNANILGRIDRHGDHASARLLREAAEKCLEISERFAKERADIEKNNHLTPDGRKAQLLESLKTRHARDLRDARKPLEDFAKSIESMRAKVKPAEIDRGDIVGALERMEIRTFVFNSTNAEKMKLLLEDADPVILDAVLSAPRALSGVPAEYYDRAKAAREEQLHGPVLRDIAAAQEVLSEARNAAAIARADLMGTIEMDQREFDRLMHPIENRTAAPWLLKQGDRVVVVAPGESVYKEATEDQLRDGKFYASMQEYQQDRAA
ncbi:hypothetical protein [Bradyrhizobium elkanii]|uniref:hypothetical protein n=1 Tax=Bradyrhizobium elkanii TaxID=29448 RepID=UPI0004ADF9CB|nr:hypothetical protein [Bradyrhizobium elkanii]WLA78816.1 hypothetical protein QNJ99_25675 [Bradyrhizobium elkanii]